MSDAVRAEPPETFYLVRLFDRAPESGPYDVDAVHEQLLDDVFGVSTCEDRTFAMPFSGGAIGDDIGFVALESTQFAEDVRKLDSEEVRENDGIREFESACSNARYVGHDEMKLLIQTMVDDPSVFIFVDETEEQRRVLGPSDVDASSVHGFVCVQCDQADEWFDDEDDR